jgi:GTP-binding protein HflX
VTKVLSEIGAAGLPMLEIYNKTDLLDGVEPHIQRDEQGLPLRVWVSAQSGAGLELLAQAMTERLAVDVIQESVVLLPAQARLRAQLYELGAVVSEEIAEDGRQQLDIRLQRSDFNRLLKREGWQMDAFIQQHVLQ